MAILNANVPTLLDLAKATDPSGKAAAIVEMLSQRNDIIDDMAFKQGNLPTGERATIRTGLPVVYWRLMNQAVPPSKSTTAQVDEQAGLLESWFEIDAALAKLNGNSSAWRLQEAQAHLEAMKQEFAQTLFYGNSGKDPEEFNGLAVRYSSLSAGNGSNILSAGGAGSDNTSIYLIGWGLNTVHGIVPSGTTAGISHKDLGEQVVTGTAGVGGSRMLALQDQFTMQAGLVVKDWRYVVRIANIDVSNLVANSGSQADLANLMIKAIHRIPNLQSVKPVFYANRTVFEMLDIQRRDDVIAGGQLSYSAVDGIPVSSFRGIPVRLTDAILETEAVVS